MDGTNEHINPVLSIIMFTVSMLYKYLGEALEIYFIGVDVFIKTGTAIIVAGTVWNMYKKWKQSKS